MGAIDSERRLHAEFIGDKNCEVSWNTQVRHPEADIIRAKITVAAASRGKCSIEVFADGIGDGLAYCRGILCANRKHTRIVWLGRSDERPAHQRVRGKRNVSGIGAGVEQEDERPSPPNQLRTLPEAVFGVVGYIAQLLGSSTIELQALDNGSGKLVQLYERLGFSKTNDQVEGGLPWLEAPSNMVACLAPEAWVTHLIPATFDAQRWFSETMRLQRAKHTLMAKPWRWEFPVNHPSGAICKARLDECASSDRYSVELNLVTPEGIELVHSKGTIRLRQRSLRLFWIGRSRGRPAHACIKGKRIYGEGEGACTVAAALLSGMAAIADSCGAHTIELSLLDDGSGKLAPYLSSLGLHESSQENTCNDGSPLFEASCDELVRRCLPIEWSASLPAKDAFAALHDLIK